jgi:hypothetical protein
MTDELAMPRICAVKDLSVGDQIQVKDFDGARVVRGGTKISAETMELKLEDSEGRIEVADFKLNEEVTVVAKNVTSSKAAKDKSKKNSSAKAAVAAKSKQKAAHATAQPAKPKKAAPDVVKKMSALNAAAKVLSEAGEPMNCQEMITAMGEKGYWTSPGGQTPSATLYSAILRETQTKGSDARFKKAERGRFTLAQTEQ